MSISLRKGVLSDMTAVYDLVVELAIYEKEEDAVHTTVKDYEVALTEGVFEVIIAEKDDTIIGMMLYYIAYSTWKGKMIYLEDFVVSEKFRRYGVGQLLFDEFMKVAKEKEAALIKWQVLDWNEPALAFYRKNKAIIEKNWWNCKVFLTN